VCLWSSFFGEASNILQSYQVFRRKVGIHFGKENFLVVAISFTAIWLGILEKALANHLSGLVFRIEVKELASPRVVSAATSFAIHPEGYLLTTFQAVSTAAIHPEKYEILVSIGENTAIAKLDSFDVIENIALIRVWRSFTRFSSIEENKTALEVGEVNAIVGFADSLNLVSTNIEFLGTKKMGYFSRFDYLFHLQKGMEGSPKVNAQGNVVSMALPVSLGKNSSSSGVRLKELQRITKSIGKNRNIASVSGWKAEIINQIFDAEKKFEPLSQNEKKAARKSFHGISFIPPGINTKCHIENVSKGKISGSAYSCYEKTQLDLDEDQSLVNSKFFVLNKPILEDQVEDFPNISAFLKEQKNRSPANTNSGICSIKNVQNTSNVKMIVRICSKEDES
jgi:hypothetical protein